MLYPELFRALEEVRWSLEQDVPWNAFDGTLLSDEQAQTIRMNAFTRIGVLMASPRRAGKALHPTKLHVARAHFPNDTVQSRLPDPAWLERWLDGQIRFDGEWEKRVSAMILHNLSSLFGHSFASAQELNRYRKSLAPA
jgi:hypothetical protein